MKVLVYGDIGGSGGYIRYCKGLFASTSIPDGLQIWFVCSAAFYEQLMPLDPEIQIITHPWIGSNSRIRRYLWYLWKYPRIVRKIKPDIEFYPSGNLRVYQRKAVTVSTCHNLLLFDPLELENIKDKTEQHYFNIYRKNQQRSFQKSGAVIFLSNYSRKVVSEEVLGIKQSIVIAHGLDKIFFSSDRSYGIGSKIKLLYVSPYYSYKHQIEVVKCVRILREKLGLDIVLNLIGGGDFSYAIQLKRYVRSEKLENFISIREKVEYESLLNEYKTSDIFIFASTCETFGITLLEAMGARLPIACSNKTGLSEILKDAGEYFTPDDPNSIAEAVEKLIMDINLRKVLAEKAYQYSLEYTWERCAVKTFNYIKEIAKKNEQ